MSVEETTASEVGPVTEEVAPEDLPRRLWGMFATFGPAYGRWMASQMGESGFSFARMKLLGTLNRSEGPIIMSGLGERLGVTPRNVTKLVDALEEEGLLRRKPHPTDRRATLIELTAYGERTVSEKFAQHVAAGAELFEALSEDEQRELLRVMGRLYNELRRRGVVEGAGGDCF